MESKQFDLECLDSCFNTIDGAIAYCKGFLKDYDEVKFTFNGSTYILVKP